MRKDSLFDKILSVACEDVEIEIRGQSHVPWADFLLNPRRLRGSDFLMRWSQGVWSEERLIQAVNETDKFFALPYGPSGTAPDNDVRKFELYFERLEQAGLGKLKRPDLLIFRQDDKQVVNQIVERLGGVQELPFTPENDANIKDLLSRAVLAVECENSLWRAKQMPDYGTALKPQRRLGGQLGMKLRAASCAVSRKKEGKEPQQAAGNCPTLLGLKKSAVLPTVIIKEEDRSPLLSWQNENRVNIHIWHVFFDMAFGIAFNTIEETL